MRKTRYYPYLLLVIFVFLTMSFPSHPLARARSLTVLSIAPSWEAVSYLKHTLLAVATSVPPQGGRVKSDQLAQEVDHLRQENQLLRSELGQIKEWLLFEDRIDQQLDRLKQLSSRKEGELFWREFFRRRSEHLAGRLELQLQALPAKVVFREPTSWSSVIWVNVGERDNEALGRSVVAKNSPVLSGTAIVGIVEDVRRRQSRIRLITDTNLVPSVRAARDQMLAKGELRGGGAPLWRSRGQVLKGVGFNYDYADEEGGARDLRSKEPLLKSGDLLVTTGLDGIFPPGFEVAVVTYIAPLKEGASAYECEAKSVAGNLDELTHVTILPPLEFDR
jgi:rod shape-determining protein MreC